MALFLLLWLSLYQHFHYKMLLSGVYNLAAKIYSELKMVL